MTGTGSLTTQEDYAMDDEQKLESVKKVVSPAALRHPVDEDRGRKPYRTPELRSYGKVADLTAENGSVLNDAAGTGKGAETGP